MNRPTWREGDAATWLHKPRGGYGYVIPVDATVVRVTPSRVRISAQRTAGDTVERSVHPDSLRPRAPSTATLPLHP